MHTFDSFGFLFGLFFGRLMIFIFFHGDATLRYSKLVKQFNTTLPRTLSSLSLNCSSCSWKVRTASSYLISTAASCTTSPSSLAESTSSRYSSRTDSSALESSTCRIGFSSACSIDGACTSSCLGSEGVGGGSAGSSFGSSGNFSE